MKSQRNERRGSRLLRPYDLPRTPFERVRASAAVDAGKVIALERLFRRRGSFVLAQHIGQHLARVASLRSRTPSRPKPKEEGTEGRLVSAGLG